MKLAPIMLVLAAFGSMIARAAAEELAALAEARGCLNCHAIDHREQAPSFKEIAASYASDPSAEATLIGELKDGQGHSKVIASDADLKALVDYVLATK